MAEYGTEREAIIGVGTSDTSGGFTGPERLVFRAEDGTYRTALVGPSLTLEYVRKRQDEGYEFVGKVYGNHGNRNFAINLQRYDAEVDRMVEHVDHWLVWHGPFDERGEYRETTENPHAAFMARHSR